MKSPRRKKQRGGRRHWARLREMFSENAKGILLSPSTEAFKRSTSIFMREPLVFDEIAEFTEDDCGAMMSLLAERDAVVRKCRTTKKSFNR